VDAALRAGLAAFEAPLVTTTASEWTVRFDLAQNDGAEEFLQSAKQFSTYMPEEALVLPVITVSASSPPNTRGRLTRILSSAGICVIVGAVLTDSLHLFSPLPKPAQVIAKVQKAAAALPTYQARLMIFGGAGSPGDTCDQWQNSQGEVVTRVKSMFGTQYVERWQGETWEFYHPGLALQGKVTVRNVARLTCPHWLISGYPTVQEIATALATANDCVVEGSGPDAGEDVWVLRCKPNLFGKGGLSTRAQPPFLTDEWRLMIPHSTRLPNRIFPSGSNSTSMSGISLASVRASSPPVQADWRSLAGPVRVAKQKHYTCDVANPASVEAVVKELRMQFQAYQRTQYPMNPNPDLR
jgi:hypothetical protein